MTTRYRDSEYDEREKRQKREYDVYPLAYNKKEIVKPIVFGSNPRDVSQLHNLKECVDK